MSVIAFWVFQMLKVDSVLRGRVAAKVNVVAGSSRTCCSTGLPQRMNRGVCDNRSRAKNEHYVEDVRADNIAIGHIRMFAQSSRDGGNKLWHGRSHSHHREADNCVRHAKTFGQVNGPIDEKAGTENGDSNAANSQHQRQ